jgi:hypothetical protein
MAITFLLFMAGYIVIVKDFQRALSNGPLLSAILLFPAFVLWLIFGNFAKHAKLSTRFLTSVAVTLAISAFGALLMQPDASVSAKNAQEAILVIGQICLAFAVSGLIASSICYGWLLRDKKTPDATLITKPIVSAPKKKRK